MTPKRLRSIAIVIRQQHPATHGWEAIAQKLEQHASELEQLGWMTGEPPIIRLKEPGTVFSEMEERFGRKS